MCALGWGGGGGAGSRRVPPEEMRGLPGFFFFFRGGGRPGPVGPGRVEDGRQPRGLLGPRRRTGGAG